MGRYEDLMLMERPLLHHVHMDQGKRAKQFAPFAALSGFEDGIAAQEIFYIDRPLLSEERREELDSKIRMLKEGIYVKAAYYQISMSNPDKGQIKEIEGKVEFLKPEISMEIDHTEIRLMDIVSLKSDIFECCEV